MRKVLIFISLIIGCAFTNAQNQYDTIMHLNEVVIYPNATTIDSLGEQYDVVTIYDSNIEIDYLNSSTTVISFDINGLDTNDYFVLYVNEFIFTHDTVGYDTIIYYDTVYIDSMNYIDTIYVEEPILLPYFRNDHYDVNISNMIGDSINIDNISFFVMNDSIGDSTSINPVNISNIYIITECDNLNIIDTDIPYEIRMFPNPTSDIIYVEGYYDTLVIYDMQGRVIVNVTDNNIRSFDISRLNNGQYLFTFDGHNTIKVIKK